MEKSADISTATLDCMYNIHGKSSEYSARLTKRKQFVSAEIITPIPSLGSVILRVTLNEIDSKTCSLVGDLFKNSEMYVVDGTIELNENLPIAINMNFKPVRKDASDISLSYKLQEPTTGYGKSLRLKLMENEKFIELNSELMIFSKVNWKFFVTAVASDGVFGVNGNTVNLITTVLPSNDGHILGNLNLETPWRELGIDAITLATNISLVDKSGNIHNTYSLPNLKGNSWYSWTWIPHKDMQLSIESHDQRSGEQIKVFQTGLKYINNNVPATKKQSKRINLALSANLNVHSLWQFDSNTTVIVVPNDMGATLSVRLPKPIGDVHKLNGRCRGNLGTAMDDNYGINYELKYETDASQRHYASRGQYRNVTDLQGFLRFEWGHDVKLDAAEANVQMLRKSMRREFSARIATPLHVEDTVMASGLYDINQDQHIFS